MRRLLPILAVILLSGCVGPARSFRGYQDKARATAAQMISLRLCGDAAVTRFRASTRN